ncbi:MAG: anthranilate synthase component I [Anaerolineae bacterium]
MYYPSLRDFRELSAQGNLLPVWREIPADMETPVSVYLKLRGEWPSFLLESVEKGEQVGRYSFIGVEPLAILTAQEEGLFLQENGLTLKLGSPECNPLAGVSEILSRYHPARMPGLPRLSGGLVGYLAYEVVRFFEPVPMPARTLSLPEMVFLLTDTLVIFDHVKHRLLLLTNAYLNVAERPEAAYSAAVEKIESLMARLRQPLSDITLPIGASAETWRSNFTRADFEMAVLRAKEYIAAGDIFQVVLSQRLSRRTKADSFTIYRALRMLNPSPYMFYLELPNDLRLIGASPEMLARLEGRKAQVRPIAGTRRRGASQTEDEALAQELLADPKERAEHIMLVDLGRNDLGRVCRYGSVRVPEMMVIERYSHVMHIVSSVEGELRPNLNACDLLQATFPAGTVSGAPKVRAMEIIAELEGEQRGPYAGAVGYFDFAGNMDTCIAIRTIVMQGDEVYIQAGAGIVADSDPAREYQETLNKAQALAEAVAIAEKGLI